MTPDDQADLNEEEEGYAAMANSLSKAVAKPEKDGQRQPSADTPVEPGPSAESQPT